MAHEVFEHIDQLDQALAHLAKQAPGLPISGLKDVVNKIRSGVEELAGEDVPAAADGPGVPQAVVSQINAQDNGDDVPDSGDNESAAGPKVAVTAPTGDPVKDGAKGRRR